jgi:hypothetical protein
VAGNIYRPLSFEIALVVAANETDSEQGRQCVSGVAEGVAEHQASSFRGQTVGFAANVSQLALRPNATTLSALNT